MDEDDLFAGSMEIDDPAANAGNNLSPAPVGTGYFGASRPDEDMSEVAEIMLNLKVCRPVCAWQALLLWASQSAWNLCANNV